jgi:peptide/nickel transport system ATP-binding protein
MTEVLLQVEALTTHLGDPACPLRVVDGVDLELRAGETFALLGESGCGKSLTALSLLRLLPPGGRVVAGRVLLQGTDLLQLPEQALRPLRGGRLGMIFQEPQTSLNPVLTVGVQIAEAVRLHDPDPPGGTLARVVALLRAVGIPDPQRRCREYPHQLSGGMKQRVMIAMALAGRPRLLIADEPTTALDVTIQAQVLALLRELQRDTGMAVLLITHDLGVVAETADRLAVMYAGEIVETAPAAAFFTAPAHPYSRRLFASLPGLTGRDRRLAAIPGRVPPPDRTWTGCRFAPRCGLALPHCRTEVPAWQSCGPGHRVRCHRWEIPEPAPESAPERAPEPGAGQEAARELLRVVGLQVHFPVRSGLLRRVTGRVRAVDGVSLVLHRGRTLALVGESGCGKTSVGKGVLQLLRPSAGQVYLNGRDLSGLGSRALRPLRRQMQIVFQDPYGSMNPRLRVGDSVAEALQAQGLAGDRRERTRQVAGLLEQVGIPAAAAERYPHEFSGGQRQRICIARALAVTPQLLVCDEPTSALDVSVQAQILNLLRDLQAQLGLAFLFITHDISVVAYMAHEVAVMYLGRIIEQGPAAALLAQPRHPYTRALLAAVPRPEPGRRVAPLPLGGDPPSPAEPPAGCHFHPRCPQATAACRARYPAPVTVGAGHWVACLGDLSGPVPVARPVLRQPAG